jgi:hypothetical protein
MDKQKLVYVASPVRTIMRSSHFPDIYHARSAIRHFAVKTCEKIKEAGHIPISPALLFEDIYCEVMERDKIMSSCKRLLEVCDEICVAGCYYSKESEGIKQELAWAKEIGITQVGYGEVENG